MIGALVIGFVLAFVANSAVCSAKADSNINVTIVHNLTKFLDENPGIKLLQPLVKEQLSDVASPKIQINYRLGNRLPSKRKQRNPK